MNYKRNKPCQIGSEIACSWEDDRCYQNMLLFKSNVKLAFVETALPPICNSMRKELERN